MNFKDNRPVLPEISVPEIDTINVEQAIQFQQECEAKKVVAAEHQIQMSKEIEEIKDNLKDNSKNTTKMNWIIIVLTAISVLIGVATLLVAILK